MAPVMLGDEEALEKVLAGRAGRSIVKPDECEAVYVKVKGSVCEKIHNEHFLLRVMNTAGEMQHAASFAEFMQQVFIEGAALDAACAAEWGGGYYDDLDSSFSEVLSSLLDDLELPWPIARFVKVASKSLFRGAIKEHRTRERGRRTLQVFASTSAIGAVPFELFAQWLVCAPMLLEDVSKLMHSAAAEYAQRGYNHPWACHVAPSGDGGRLYDEDFYDEDDGITWSTTAAASPSPDESVY
ncbi:hypothetical protein M885DRAFT_557141 [Pelagophyceae sp. CCMP2097]|nr:hypothetical protein M885DRAFT_557141 [Pelagophyceae sp. CCMP2097]